MTTWKSRHRRRRACPILSLLFIFILWALELWWDFQLFFLWFHTCRNNSKSFSAQQCLAWDLNHLFDVCLLNLYCPHPSLSPQDDDDEATTTFFNSSSFARCLRVLSVLDSIITPQKKNPPTLSRRSKNCANICRCSRFHLLIVSTHFLRCTLYFSQWPSQSSVWRDKFIVFQWSSAGRLQRVVVNGGKWEIWVWFFSLWSREEKLHRTHRRETCRKKWEISSRQH